MNKDTLKGQWKRLRGKVKTHWADFTDDELDRIDGEYDQLVGKIQEKYGRTREQAEKELKSLLN